MLQFLEGAAPHTVGHSIPRDRRSFDGLEQFLLGGAVLDGPTHVRCHAISEAPRRQNPHHYQFFYLYTAEGSSISNDMVLRTSPIVDQRQERVRGFRTKYLNGDVPPDGVARISCTLGLSDGAGYVRLASADPTVQPVFNYRYLQHLNDRRRVRDGLRVGWVV